ncbi:MAG: DUF3054 domain-containing protein [Halobacteriales archaeon]
MGGSDGPRLDLSRRTGALLAGDLLAIGLFVAAGELRHGGTLAAGSVTFAQFAAGWLLAAVALGAYGGTAIASLRRAGALAAGGWVVGACLGVVIRAAVRPGFYIAPAFLAVAIGVGGVLLVGWRLLAAVAL